MDVKADSLLGFPGDVLGRLGHVLGHVLGVSWGLLECLGASWRRLGPDVRSKRDLTEAFHLVWHFFNRLVVDFPSENRSQNFLANHQNLIEKL